MMTNTIEQKITFEQIPQAVSELLEKVNKAYEMLTSLIKQTPNKKRLPIGVPEAAQILRISEQTVYDYTKTADLPHYRKKKLLYFYEDELIAWIEEGRVKNRLQIEKEVSDTLAKQKKG